MNPVHSRHNSEEFICGVANDKIVVTKLTLQQRHTPIVSSTFDHPVEIRARQTDSQTCLRQPQADRTSDEDDSHWVAQWRCRSKGWSPVRDGNLKEPGLFEKRRFPN